MATWNTLKVSCDQHYIFIIHKIKEKQNLFKMQKGTKTKTDHNPLIFLPKQIQDGGYFQMVGQMISDFDSQYDVCVCVCV